MTSSFIFSKIRVVIDMVFIPVRGGLRVCSKKIITQLVPSELEMVASISQSISNTIEECHALPKTKVGVLDTAAAPIFG